MTLAEACRHSLANTWLRCSRCGSDRWRERTPAFGARGWSCESCVDTTVMRVLDSQVGLCVWHLAPRLARICRPPAGRA